MSGVGDAGADGGTMWLTREADVIAHLCFVAAEIGEVTLELGGERVRALLAFPEQQSRTVDVDIDPASREAPFTPLNGAVVRVSYARGPANYSWLTGVVQTQSADLWSLAFPSTIERNERRIVSRHRVLGRAGFRLRINMPDGTDRAMPLFDISTAGLGFVYRPGTIAMLEGVELSCRLTLPAGDSLDLVMVVANFRPVPGGGVDRVVGCRFHSMPPELRGDLARALANVETESV